jgi:lactoylglutathione lyase
MCHRPRHLRDRSREADEQADRHDERHGEERVLDGGLSSRHAETLRHNVSHVGRGKWQERAEPRASRWYAQAMAEKARLIGMNHIALEVGDVDEALALYGRLFDFTMRGRGRRMAFVDMGDQFLAIAEGRSQPPDDERHFGLVVDDVAAARDAVRDEGLEIASDSGKSFDFRDPWGNRFQVVGYSDVQFERTDGVKRKLGIEDLGKTDDARHQISERGLG